MIAYLTRRDFLRASAIASAALLSGKFSFGQDAAPKPRWYKGNLHMHNQWSDGLPLPEQAVAWYKDRGWDFICPSDHNCFQGTDLHFTSFGSKPKMTDEMIAAFEGETSLWKPIKNPNVENKLEREIVDKAIEELGAAGVKIKEAGGMTFV
ncbi:MAG: twin-arginine translocation signal domain-containing protein, partial [Thermoguttaceae bacterium]|nr:twin-arginine translocation signal domain-containing protein [Thermoguttaceae bacterium]